MFRKLSSKFFPAVGRACCLCPTFSCFKLSGNEKLLPDLPNLDVGRNKTARRQQGWTFPAIGAPEKLPLLLTPLAYIHVGNASLARLTRGQAYSCLRRDVYNDESSAWERGVNVKVGGANPDPHRCKACTPHFNFTRKAES